jgi:hypothetical protein
LGDQESQVVGQVSATEFLDRGEDEGKKRFDGQLRVGAKNFQQTRLAELLFSGVKCLGDTVGVEGFTRRCKIRPLSESSTQYGTDKVCSPNLLDHVSEAPACPCCAKTPSLASRHASKDQHSSVVVFLAFPEAPAC